MNIDNSKPEDFLDTISKVRHELGQSLQIIDGYCSLLLLNSPAEGPQHEYAHKIKNQIAVMGETVKRLSEIIRRQKMTS